MVDFRHEQNFSYLVLEYIENGSNIRGKGEDIYSDLFIEVFKEIKKIKKITPNIKNQELNREELKINKLSNAVIL